MKFLIFIIFLIILVNFSQSCLPTQKGKRLLELDITRDSASALMMLNEYGLKKNPKDHVCEHIDKKTNQIFGHSICKQVVELMIPFSVQMPVTAKCAFLNNHEQQLEHIYERIPPNTMAVKCTYDKGEFDNFFVINAPNEHYYVFVQNRENKYLEIAACLKIQIRAIDYPQIVIEETEDEQKADNIFSKFDAVTPKYGDKHVCSILIRETRTILGEAICEKIMNRQNKLFMDSVKVSCDSVAITRRRTVKLGGLPTKTRIKYDGAKCWYSDKGIPKMMMVFNAPFIGFYYTASSDVKNQWYITSCMRIQ